MSWGVIAAEDGVTLDDRLVFSKTPKGVSEVAVRSNVLTLPARRVLIMVDGRRTVADLAPLLRPGEIEVVLLALETQGFIMRSGAEALTRPTSGPAPFNSSAAAFEVNAPPVAEPPPEERNLLTIDEAKRRAVRELVDRLGPDGEMMALRIEQCRGADELRERLRESERLVSGVLGEAAAQEYVRSLRLGRAR